MTTPATGRPPRLETVISLSATVHCDTGLRVGAAETTIAIGGIDNPIIRNPLTGEPYIPGSSLKGKLRSLLERRYELPQNWAIDRGRVHVHVCEQEAEYRQCPVCPVFGVAAPQRARWFCLSRLRVPDVALTESSRQELQDKATDFPYTEVKTEVAIDRLTSAATPRPMERVPAGAEFGPARFILFRYAGDDIRQHLGVLLEGLELLEADYLGSAGSRGSGRVSFRNIGVELLDFPIGGGLPVRTVLTTEPLPRLQDMVQQFDELVPGLSGGTRRG
jgi:CRISPR-associated protein Csm3